MKKLILPLVAGLMPMGAMANPACPVCTIAIGAALPILHRWGIANDVAGLWFGALLAIMGYWIIKFMDKRNWHFWGRNALILTLSVATIGFAYLGKVDYTPCEYAFGLRVDPLLFGTVWGALLFIITEKIYDWMKIRNGGHAHFPFEKVVLPVVVLIVASVILFKCA